MSIKIRRADLNDLTNVTNILVEAEKWLQENNMSLWKMSELSPEMVRQEIKEGLYHLVFLNKEPAGTFKYQQEDPLMWPDATPGDAAYIHRLAVKRKFAGGDVSYAIMNWALGQAKVDGYRYLRLDTDINRPKLQAIYENFGFTYHSDHIAGPYHVARYQYYLD